jgi:uncharacterized membrane protein YdfJ with MMPL/SSD domain
MTGGAGRWERLAGLLWRRAGLVLVATVLFVGVGGWGAATVSSRFAQGTHAGFRNESSPSEKAEGPAVRATGARLDASLVAVVRSRAAVGRVAAAMRAEPLVVRTATMPSKDRRSAYVAAWTMPTGDQARKVRLDRVRARLTGVPGVTVAQTDRTFDEINEQLGHDLPRIELVAVPLLLLLSFLVFRGLVAALLPILVAVVAVAATLLGLRLLTEVMTVSPFALNLATGLGLGLAIDYSLLIVSRYREELVKHGAGPAALGATLSSAGKTVAFSASTVAAALLCLLAFRLNALASMGVSGAMVALTAAAAAILPMSALLALLGDRVNALAPARLQRSAQRTARPEQSGGWYRLAHLVMRRPAIISLVCVGALVAAGLPALRAHLGFTDARSLPSHFASSRVAEALGRDFPADATHPIVVLARPAPRAQLDRYLDEIRALPGAFSATVKPDPTGGSIVSVLSTGPPDAPVSQHLVSELKKLAPPFGVAVTGSAAINFEEGGTVGHRIPLAAVLLALSTLFVLFVMTRSVLLPFKAVLMNVVTGTATCGLLVLVFQDARLSGLLGFQKTGYLDRNNLLLLLFLVLGLSTDYGVFLLARIKEAHDTGVDNREAVARGLERTGRIVTAAALLFCVAVGASAASTILVVKEFAVGAAFAVLVDATIVRVLLVPALMALLGEANWWAPPFLRSYPGTRPIATRYSASK